MKRIIPIIFLLVCCANVVCAKYIMISGRIESVPSDALEEVFEWLFTTKVGYTLDSAIIDGVDDGRLLGNGGPLFSPDHPDGVSTGSILVNIDSITNEIIEIPYQIKLDPPDTNGGFSFGLWVKASVVDATSQVLVVRRSIAGGASLFTAFIITNGGWRVVVDDDNSDPVMEVNAPGNIATGVWHHLGFAYDGDKHTGFLYTNGLLAATNLFVLDFSVSSGWVDQKIQLGDREVGSSLPFRGGRFDQFLYPTSIWTSAEFFALAVSNDIPQTNTLLVRLEFISDPPRVIQDTAGPHDGDVNLNTANEAFHTNGTYDCDGTDDYFFTTNSIGYSNLTRGAISLWAKIDADDGAANILFALGKVGEGGDPTIFNGRMDMALDRIRLFLRTNSVILFDATTPTDSLDFTVGEWALIVINQDGSDFGISINGATQLLDIATSVDSGAFFSTMFDSTVPPDNLSIGIFNGSSLSGAFDGRFDDITIYSEPLTLQQQTNLFLLGPPD